MRFFEHLNLGFVREAPEAAGSGGGDVAAGSAATVTDAPDSSEQGAVEAGTVAKVDGAEQPSFYKPEGLPEHLLGSNDKETIDRLADAYNGARKAMGSVPNEPKDYAFEAPDALKPYLPADDPMLSQAYEAAHKLKISKEQFQGLIESTFLPMIDKGLIRAPFDSAKEVDALRSALALPEGEQGSVELKKQVNDMIAYTNGLSQQLQFSDGEKAELDALLDSSNGFTMVAKLKAALSQKGIQVDGQAAQGEDVKAWLKQMDSDPRVDPNKPQFDPELRKKYDQAYQQAYT